ncbi:unnamed protein product [Closterium sp. NIES-53]
MGEVGDASVFRVWGSRAFVCDTSADKLSPRAIPCVFLGFVPDAPGWQFYHPTSRRVFPSMDITFDVLVPFYHLFPYRSAPQPPPPLFLAPSPPPVDPLPTHGPAPLGVSQVDPLLDTAPVEVAVGLGAARGAASGGVASGGAEPGVAESKGAGFGGAELGGEKLGGAEPAGVEPESVEPGGAESEGAESGGAEPRGAALTGGPAGASPRLSPQQLREWLVWHARLRSGATGAEGAGAAGAGGTGGTTAAGPGGARTRGTGAAGTGSVGGAGAGDPTKPEAAGAGGSGAGGARAGGAGVGGPGTGGAGAGGTDTGGAGAGGAGVGVTGEGGGGAGGAGAVDPGGTPASLLPAPSPCTEQSGGLTERREPASRPASPVFSARHVPRSRPLPVPRTHTMTLRPSSVPLHVPLLAPPESSLPEVLDPETDRACAARPTVSCLLATAVSDPSFDSAAAFFLVAELLDFAAACCLDYATALIAESESDSPPSVRELVGCLMYLMSCTRPDLAYPLSLLARYVAPGRHRKVHWDAAKRVLRYLCSTSGMGLVLGGRGPVVLTNQADASCVDNSATQRSSQGYTFSLEQPHSPPVLYVDNKAMIALCQEHRLEHRMNHIALRYFLARELQQRDQLRLAYVATRANTADVFTKALPPGEHQRFVTVLGLVPTLPHLLTG